MPKSSLNGVTDSSGMGEQAGAQPIFVRMAPWSGFHFCASTELQRALLPRDSLDVARSTMRPCGTLEEELDLRAIVYSPQRFSM